MRSATALLLGVFACTTPVEEPTPDAGTDAPPRTCRTDVADALTVSVDAVGRHQSFPRLAFDGSIWIAYARVPEGGSGFDPWAVRLDCDGSVRTAPFRLNTTDGTNDVDVRLAIGPEAILFAWTSDDSNATPNATIRYRLFDREGSALTDERVLETTLPDDAAVPPTWSPAVAALDDGTFAIAGTRGLEGTYGFQPFVQRIDATGKLLGTTLGYSESQATASHPAIAASGNLLHVAWTREDVTGAISVLRAVIEPDATSLMPEPAASGRPGEYPAVAAVENTTVLALTAVGETERTTLLESIATGHTLELGALQRFDDGPQVALASARVGAVAWFRTTGTGREAWVQRIAIASDGKLSARFPVRIPTDASINPARVPLVHVEGDTYFVAWSEGAGPEARVRGRFVTLVD